MKSNNLFGFSNALVQDSYVDWGIPNALIAGKFTECVSTTGNTFSAKSVGSLISIIEKPLNGGVDAVILNDFRITWKGITDIFSAGVSVIVFRYDPDHFRFRFFFPGSSLLLSENAFLTILADYARPHGAKVFITDGKEEKYVKIVKG